MKLLKHSGHTANGTITNKLTERIHSEVVSRPASGSSEALWNEGYYNIFTTIRGVKERCITKLKKVTQ